MKRNVSDVFPIGTDIFFRSGNFIGSNGKVMEVDDASKHPSAIFGFLITVKLDNGQTVFVEKTEHIQKLKL